MRIKMGVRWFPRTIFSTPRKSGKTTALLEIIYEDHGGQAIYFCQSAQSAADAAHRYAKMFHVHKSEFPLFHHDAKTLESAVGGRGILPIYVDEWWAIDRAQQDILAYCGVIRGRVGTEF